MKYKEAIDIIRKNEKNPRFSKTPDAGFMISFEKRSGGLLESQYFPEKHDNEPLIKTEEEAWRLAKRFAAATNESIVNIYVVDSEFSPVQGYDRKTIRRY